MNTSRIAFAVICFVAFFGSFGVAAAARDDVPLNDIPKELKAPTVDRNYTRRVEMIPMRDGVKLHTIILVPKGAQNAPILLTRTPYNAEQRAKRAASASLLSTLQLSDEEFVKARLHPRLSGLARQVQIRRQLRDGVAGARSAESDQDGSCDRRLGHDRLAGEERPESNGRVGMIGSSYEGFTVAMALLDPHPALKAAVPESPLMDGWMGDDWFHHGAFRQIMLAYIYMQTAGRGEGIYSGLGDAAAARNTHDDYETFLRAGSAGDFIRKYGFDQLPWVTRTMAHPAYDAYWQGQALDKLLAARPYSVPTLWEQGLWDSDDIYGANKAWLAQKAAGRVANNWLVMGPWRHSQINGTGYDLGPLRWEGDTSRQYNRDMVLPFFEHYLRDGPAHKLPRVTVYNIGANRWEHFDDWPVVCERGCAQGMKPLYLRESSGLSFERPSGAEGLADTYISDPAKPVPYIPRPMVDLFSNMGGGSWSAYGDSLVTDQRFVDGRPDVLTYETPVLTSPVRVSGIPVVDLRAMTSGSDADFVVKLIDVYPADHPGDAKLRGYQLPLAMDILRGRYRTSFEKPAAITPNQPLQYKFELPNVNHVFQPGHRIMIQIQSTWFPLYDRNPQTFVPNIFDARPSDYQKAQITVLRSGDQPTAILLPVVN